MRDAGERSLSVRVRQLCDSSKFRCDVPRAQRLGRRSLLRSVARSPLPSAESRGQRFPGFVGTTGDSDSCVFVALHFVAFIRRYLDCTRCSLPRARGRRSGAWHHRRGAFRCSTRKHTGLSGSWGTPMPACRALGPRGATTPGTRRRRVAFRSEDHVGLPSLSFGAGSHGPQARCPRFAGRVAPTPRKTRLRAVASRSPGLVTRWVPLRAFAWLLSSCFLLPGVRRHVK